MPASLDNRPLAETLISAIHTDMIQESEHMNHMKEIYTKFGLVRDMLSVPDIIRSFDVQRMRGTSQTISQVGRLLMTGEGSSRLFPAKSAIATARRHGWPLVLHTEAGFQSQEYNLEDWAIFALSNSGRTAEAVGLFEQLERAGHQHRYSLTAFPNSKLESLANAGYVLTCGEEQAVAATKSVIEQALFLRALVQNAGNGEFTANLDQLAAAFESALTTPIDPRLVDRVCQARTIYWAGRNDGVAEELTLKTNEITRKTADFLEGTYAVHGIEEVMEPGDVVICVDPYPGSEEKFETVLVKGIGLSVIAIAPRPTRFPTIITTDVGEFSSFVQMAAGWNLLVEIGMALGIDIDKPSRARKVGNEYQSPTP
jgi:glucosamine--fructose-6-phosphate aminotransferase (isomerizing)